ncbi:MAG TPA: hypothetical protein VKE74_05285, partial [Gemmataceae bacterium]|nr:hypothetical protein [Gemmataceae bacterium]
MLRPDKAEKELAAFKSDLHFTARVSRVKKLAKAPKEVGFALLDRDADGNVINNWQQRQKIQKNLAARLERLADKQRGELFAALYPKLATHLEGAWQLFATLPYQTGYHRKSFRAPAHPMAARQRRYQWLNTTLERLHSLDPDIEWLATWAGYLYYRSSDDNSGYTLAAAINGGGAEGEKVFSILKDSASNLHPIGAMGRHITRALFVCEKPEAWTFMEKFLLAAQRQEGLRQVILETVDEAHPQAFRRMLRLIRDHELARFSAVVRSVDVWFGFMWDSATLTVVNKAIDRAISYLDDPKERQAALKSNDGEQTYLALWALGYDDVDAVFPAAEPVLKKGNAESRFAAITLLRHLGTPLARKQLLAAMDDADLRVAVTAFNAAQPHCPKPAATNDEDDEDDEWVADEVEDMFERIETLFARLPDSPQSLKPLVWPWSAMTVSKDTVAGQLPYYLGDRPPERLLPYLPKLGSWQKVQAMQTLVKRKPLREDVREVLFTLVRDSASYVRNQAVEMVSKLKLEPGEPEKLELALTRGASDLRRAVLAVLMKQKEKAIDDSADRLLVSANKN